MALKVVPDPVGLEKCKGSLEHDLLAPISSGLCVVVSMCAVLVSGGALSKFRAIA